MNLHIFPDDKFVDEFIAVANDVSSESNTFVINADRPLRYVKNNHVHVAKYGSQEFDSIVGDLSQYKRAYIHFLTQAMCHFINDHANSSVIFLWVFWGADLYNNIPYQVFDEQTRTYKNEHTNENNTNLLSSVNSWRSKRIARYERLKAIQRLNYILHFDEEEYKIIRRYFPTKAKYCFFSYPNVLNLEYLDSKPEPQNLRILMRDLCIDPAKKMILMGNSGWETGNHLSILQKLAPQKLDGQQVIVPLSYGNLVYIDFVISEGTRLLQANFKPITTFLTPQVYSYLLQMVEAGVFNSWRTQGAGNIVALLYLGKRVYINPKATYYHFLRQKGVAVNTIDQFFSTKIAPLDSDSIQLNREIILNMYSEQACKNTISNILLLD